MCDVCGRNVTEELGKHAEVALTMNVCLCGALLPHTRAEVKGYFDLMGIGRHLPKVVQLVMKSELVSAVREATVTLEDVVRKKSGLSARGADLMHLAFRFEWNKQTQQLEKAPPIQLSNLATEAKRDEQRGIESLCAGIMQGARNIYMHSRATEKFYYCLHVVTLVDFLLEQIVGDYGTMAEDRTMFSVEIPVEHRGHKYSLRDVSWEAETYYCETCQRTFRARKRVIIRD